MRKMMQIQNKVLMFLVKLQLVKISYIHLPPQSFSLAMSTIQNPKQDHDQQQSNQTPETISMQPTSIDGLTPEHLKLLYLISRYSHCAQNKQEKETWIKVIPLLVFIYEGIVAKVFDYDYAPRAEIINTRHIYMNISQVLYYNFDLIYIRKVKMILMI